jgi:acyl carrier protein phosphodiesterase
MNFLAHLYLSGSDQSIMIGNFIADSVKGKEVYQYSSDIQKGIRLHRFIDQYTDTHSVIHEAKQIIAPYFGKYNAVVLDIYMDHFLAKDWSAYSSIQLYEFASAVYELLQEEINTLPQRVQELLPYMIRQDWLCNYANFEGIDKVFRGMSKRASFESHMEDAAGILKEHYAEMQQCFDLFFPQLVEASNVQLNEIKSQ